MAVALDVANEVLSVFSRSNRTEMTLIELQSSLATRMTTDEVLRIIRLPNLVNLFNLQPISNNLCLIQLSPKLTLCEACLQRGCKNAMHCSQLHLCRYISHFSRKPLEKPCRFPHQLSDHPNNLLLLRKFKYDTLNEELLLNLLRLHYEQSQPEHDRYHSNKTPSKTPNHRVNRARPPSQPQQSFIPTDNITERQLYISIPPQRDAAEVDLEIVQLLLATKDIIVEPILDKQISNEFYRRFTLQLKEKQIIDQLLQNESIIMYNNIPIKMKRTFKQKDTKIFALKFSTDQKIDQIRLNLYIETLVGKINSNILDMTPDGNDEQIYIIRCEKSIDFDHLYKVHSSKNTLQGHRVIITEVYETESLEVSFAPGSSHLSMTLPRLRQLLGETRWREDVFACLSIRDRKSADIELMNADITAKWLAEAHRFERDLSLTIHPIIDFIQSQDKNTEEEVDDEEVTKLLTTPKISSSLSSLNLSEDSPKGDNDPQIYTIRPDWRIVLTHPVFGDEYRKYIRENMNISVQIIGSAIQIPNAYVRKELARYTNMFTQHFIFQEMSDLDKNQVKLIKENYSRMAHKWQKDTNKTLIAARRDVMNELFPRTTSANQKPLTTPTFRSKQSPSPRKLEQSTPPIVEEPLQTKTTEHTLPYSIENSVYFPFFTSSNSFPDRLRTYLSNTFNVQLDIKTVSSTKILLELKGQHKDVTDARPALTLLFNSLKTKTYSDPDDSGKFAIPDAYRVAQWNLDRCSIASSCSFTPKNGGTLSVRYFADNPHFGVDEQKIDDLILHHLLGISSQVLATSKKLEMNLEQLQNQIQQRSDYGQNISCFYHHQKSFPSLRLYGTKTIVQQIDKEVKKILDEFTPIPCNVQLQSNQVNYLLKICANELMKFEKEYENDGVDIQSQLKPDTISPILAPKSLHEKVKSFLRDMSQIQMISKDLKCSLQIINQKKHELNKLAEKHRCLISIKSASSQPTIPPTSESIYISDGDLTTEQSDVLVVCSTSVMLRNTMLKAAGPQVEQELTGEDLTKNMIDTSAGQLKQAKRLLFLPWTPPATFLKNQDINALRQSISTFIQQAIKYTIQGKFKSIAFPAIGCGGYGIPADIIATIMIDTVREQLTMYPTAQLRVTFVVPQPNVCDVFKAKLKPTSTASGTSSSSHLSNQEKVTITLTTSISNLVLAQNLLKIYEDLLNSSH